MSDDCKWTPVSKPEQRTAIEKTVHGFELATPAYCQVLFRSDPPGETLTLKVFVIRYEGWFCLYTLAAGDQAYLARRDFQPFPSLKEGLMAAWVEAELHWAHTRKFEILKEAG